MRLPDWHKADLMCCCQIDFLNSVIVDLQRKNETLQSQLEAALSCQINDSSAADLKSVRCLLVKLGSQLYLHSWPLLNVLELFEAYKIQSCKNIFFNHFICIPQY